MEQPAKIMITATTPIRLQEIQETLYDGAFVKKMFQELIKKQNWTCSSLVQPNWDRALHCGSLSRPGSYCKSEISKRLYSKH